MTAIAILLLAVGLFLLERVWQQREFMPYSLAKAVIGGAFLLIITSVIMVGFARN